MEKLLKVCSVPYGRKHEIGINIKGKYLEKYGFELGDFVKVSVSNGRILIEKTPETETIRNMGIKNPEFLKLMERLDLVPKSA